MIRGGLKGDCGVQGGEAPPWSRGGCGHTSKLASCHSLTHSVCLSSVFGRRLFDLNCLAFEVYQALVIRKKLTTAIHRASCRKWPQMRSKRATSRSRRHIGHANQGAQDWTRSSGPLGKSATSKKRVSMATSTILRSTLTEVPKMPYVRSSQPRCEQRQSEMMVWISVSRPKASG
jgi:hypothetical protein